MEAPLYDIVILSESAVIIAFEQILDERINHWVAHIANQLNAEPFSGFIELVPAYASLAVYFNPVITRKLGKSIVDFLYEKLSKLLKDNHLIEHHFNNNVVEIPVIYDGEDLSYVCNQTGLSKNELIKLHTEPLYRVYMLGFLPGFAYLGGMNKRLAVPRRDSPRLKVAAGSVGVAGEQTGVYPVESPGGWQLIGQTAIELFSTSEIQVSLLKQGDYVRFIEVV